MERRFQLIADAEVRGSGRGLTGYAAVFDRKASIGTFTEVIRSGAFRNTLAENRDILGCIDHEVTKVIGRTGAGTLKLAEDSRGLHFDITELPDTSYANDLLALVRSGNVGGCSFQFSVPPGGDVWEGRSRTLNNVHLHEISVISGFPAYSGTSVAARAAMSDDTRAALLRRLSLAVS
jgi:uncharacterized protein